MKIFSRIKTVILLLCQLVCHNPIKTVWFNFKVLPFRQAIYLPILLYGKAEFRNIQRGGVVIDCERVAPFMIKIGYDDWYVTTGVPKVLWSIYGKMILTGPIHFLQGSYIMVGQNGVLRLGSKGTFLGSNSKIICFDRIEIGDNVQVTWDVQMYDTAFHYITNENSETSKLTNPITIGNNVWIGNNATISRGCVLPDNMIVASHSLANKDYSPYTKSIISGVPAKVKQQNVHRVWDKNEEANLDAQYGYTRNHL